MCLHLTVDEIRKAIKEEINDPSTYVFSRLQNHKAVIVVKSVHQEMLHQQMLGFYKIYSLKVNSNKRNYSKNSENLTKEAATGGVLIRKGIVIDFAKFRRKHLRQSLFFKKIACLRPAILLKKRLWHRCFPVKFAKFLRTSILKKITEQLLLTSYTLNFHL